MNFEGLEQKQQLELVGLSEEEIFDIQELGNRLLVLPEQGQFSDLENTEDAINKLYSSLEKGFLEVIPQVGFERDEALEIRTQEEGLSNEERIKRQENLLREYIKRMQNTSVGWGFTPAIVARNEKEFKGLDCLGSTIALAALLRKNGIEVSKGQTAGHAMVLAKIGDTLWYADGRNSIMIPITEKGEEYKDETVYKFSDSTISKLDLPYNILISCRVRFLGRPGFLRVISSPNSLTILSSQELLPNGLLLLTDPMQDYYYIVDLIQTVPDTFSHPLDVRTF